MARCGCAGFGACNCRITASGGLTVQGTGGASDPYHIIGPTLFADDTEGFDMTLIGEGTLAAPWRITVRPKVYTTATRPSASTAGDGMMIYDTTINKPLWSDGSVWRDAAGAVV
jgi:hypothetical protein